MHPRRLGLYTARCIGWSVGRLVVEIVSTDGIEGIQKNFYHFLVGGGQSYEGVMYLCAWIYAESFGSLRALHCSIAEANLFFGHATSAETSEGVSCRRLVDSGCSLC